LFSIGAASGPPPDGELRSSTFPRQSADVSVEKLLADRTLLPGRVCLEPLRSLSLRCLSWEPASRPSAQTCADDVRKWLSFSDLPNSSFVELWLQHSSRLPERLTELAWPRPTELTDPQTKSNHLALLEAADSEDSETADEFPLGRQAPSLDQGAEQASEGVASEERKDVGPEIPGRCSCARSVCGLHRKGRCANTASVHSFYKVCASCTCKEEDCGSLQYGKQGYCFFHQWRSWPPELLLVRALGAALSPASLTQELCPANLQVFRRVCGDYLIKFQKMDPVFEVVAAWLDHPAWVQAWANNRLPPNSGPEALVAAIHTTVRQMSSHRSSEADFQEKPTSGIGFFSCCSWLGLVEEIPTSPEEPAHREDLVDLVGPKKITWRLVKAANSSVRKKTARV